MSCATLRGGLAWRSCVEVLRRGLAWTLKWSKVPEDSSDFDDFWTELIVMTWTFILAILQKNLQKYFRPFPGRRFCFRPFPDRRFFVRRFPDRRFFLWRSCAGVLRGHVARVLRLTFRYVLRRVLRDLARLIFRWLTFSVKHSSGWLRWH